MTFRSRLLLCLLLLPGITLGARLDGEVVGIADGDTLTLLVDETQHKVRLAEIDTPESGQPWGNRARQALADKVFRQAVRVAVVDVDRYDRKVGKIWLSVVQESEFRHGDVQHGQHAEHVSDFRAEGTVTGVIRVREP